MDFVSYINYSLDVAFRCDNSFVTDYNAETVKIYVVMGILPVFYYLMTL